MPQSVHDRAVAHFLSGCAGLAVRSILAYGSYARGDNRPDSDVDLLVVLDSKKYHYDDLRGLVEIGELVRNEFGVNLNMDVMLDSEIELWNKGVLLEGHSYIDPSFYRKDGRILYGEDVRDLFRLPKNLRERAGLLLGIIESEFKRYVLNAGAKRTTVPHWLTGWLLVTYMNTLGVTELFSFRETCRVAGEIPLLKGMTQLSKYTDKKELTVDEFIELFRTLKGDAGRRR